MNVDIHRLGINAQLQILEAIKQQEKQRRATPPRQMLSDNFDSEAERQYYNRVVFPQIAAGLVEQVELHKTFLLLDADEYCGIKLHKAEYTPDFIITYKDGHVEVVEVKSKAVRRLQGSYVYRRRLFIDKYARPSGWAFTEIITEDAKQQASQPIANRPNERYKK